MFVASQRRTPSTSLGDNLDPVEGTYKETWVSDSQWRRETVIGNPRQIDVGGSDMHWLASSDDFPEQANALPGRRRRKTRIGSMHRLSGCKHRQSVDVRKITGINENPERATDD